MANYDLQLFFKELLNRKDPSVPFSFLPKTDEWETSITYGRLRIIGSFTFLNMSLDTVVEALGEEEKFLLEHFTHIKKTIWR